jgi:hypothetical protein
VAKRMVLMLAVAGLLITSLGFVKFRQIQTAIAKGGSFQPPPTAVTTIVAKQETWSATLDVIGTAVAVQGGFRFWQIGQCRGCAGRAGYATGAGSIGGYGGPARLGAH